ncbi:hypothetical protein RIU05_12440 [Riemerella anatipestifer]|nr:hypothetical protein [Riemerella anatipestifer]
MHNGLKYIIMINKNLKLFYFKYIKNTIETKTLKKIIRALGGKNIEITNKLEEEFDKFRTRCAL